MTLLSSIQQSIALSSPEPKILLTPRYLNPGVLKRNLAMVAGQLANVQVRPFREFLVEQALPQFHGKTYMSGDRRFWMMYELLKSIKHNLAYFSDVIQFEGICSLIVDTIVELRLNGVIADNLKAMPHRSKWEDMQLIIEAYEKEKVARALFDYADAVVAISQPSSGPPTYVIDHPLSALERGIVGAAGMVIIPVMPGGFQPEYALSGFKCDTSYQEALQTIRNVMEDIPDAGVPVRIGICTPHYNESFSLIAPVLEKIGQPDMVHFLKGTPVFSTLPGTLWKYFGEWILQGYTVAGLVRILECTGFRRESDTAGEFRSAVRHFRKSGLLLVNGEFPGAFKDYLAGERDEDEDGQEIEAEGIQLALDIAERFCALLSERTPTDQLRILQKIFVDSARVKSQADAASIARLEALLEETEETLATLGIESSLGDIVRLIGEKLDGLYVDVRLPDGSRPVVGTMEDLLYHEVDTLYVLGMNEKGPPGVVYENPLLLDEEKRLLGDAIPGASFLLREDHLANAQSTFDALKSVAQQRLVMSAPMKDLTTGRELLVSRFLLAEWNRYHGRHHDYRGIARILGEDPRSANNHIPEDPKESLFPFEMAVALHALYPRRPKQNPLLERLFPFASRSRSYRRSRAAATRFDAYWGVIMPEKDRELPVMSATRFSTWSRCPYQYFLRYELFLELPEELDITGLEWLDHLAYGNFLHEVYYTFFIRLRERRGEEFTVVDGKDEDLLWKEFDAAVQRYQALYPVTSRFHYEATVARLRQDVGGFFERELKNPSARCFAELSFNMMDKAGREPLVRKGDPATIRLLDGNTLQVRGAIDRVDRREDGRYLLLDYKSGRFFRPGDVQPFGGGKLMQAGLYSEVVGQIDPRITNPLFAYYYATARSDFETYHIDYPAHRKHFLSFLTTMVGEIRRGNFVPVIARKDSPPCSFCDYSAVCIDGRKGVGEVFKESDPDHHRYQQIVSTEKEPDQWMTVVAE